MKVYVWKVLLFFFEEMNYRFWRVCRDFVVIVYVMCLLSIVGLSKFWEMMVWSVVIILNNVF